MAVILSLRKLLNILGPATKCLATDKYPDCYIDSNGFVTFQCGCLGKRIDDSETIEMRSYTNEWCMRACERAPS
jgi:hypothetical protein